MPGGRDRLNVLLDTDGDLDLDTLDQLVEQSEAENRSEYIRTLIRQDRQADTS